VSLIHHPEKLKLYFREITMSTIEGDNLTAKLEV
jgi:hypothetical protein